MRGSSRSATSWFCASLSATRLRRCWPRRPELRGHPELEQRLSERLVGVSMTAARLLAKERELDEGIHRRSAPTALASAQAAGDMNSGRAVNQASSALRNAREAIDFPTFVTSLISGVFQAIQNSSVQQLQAVMDLMDAVGSSTEEFSTANFSTDRAVVWAAERFSAFRIDRSGGSPQLELKEDAQLPERAELARVLGATEAEVAAISEGDLEESLNPARAAQARTRSSVDAGDDGQDGAAASRGR